jgi:AraC-like DNA-binding protein
MPNQAHEFIFSESIDIYNCQFYLDELQGVFIDIVNSLSFPNLRSTAFEFSNPDTLLTLPMTIPVPADQPETSRYAPLNMQGIIHTSYTQALYLEGLFEKIITEQTDRLLRYSYVVKNCLEEVLIVIERIMASQFQYDQDIPQKHKTIIENVLAYVDTHYQEPLNFSDIAAAQNLSPNYFRKIFKTYTGTSPVDHLNRIRVLKALELLRDHKRLSSSGAAEQVGILDANYFTRLFKKYIGFPPSHFTRNRPV